MQGVARGSLAARRSACFKNCGAVDGGEAGMRLAEIAENACDSATPRKPTRAAKFGGRWYVPRSSKSKLKGTIRVLYLIEELQLPFNWTLERWSPKYEKLRNNRTKSETPTAFTLEQAGGVIQQGGVQAGPAWREVR